jgi:hypothetical protein
MQLALRVVHALGTVAPPSRVSTERSIAQLLVAVFGPAATLGELDRLTTAQLQRLLAQRIRQDYQHGALVQHQGWWLASSESAILELDWRLGRRAQPRASLHPGCAPASHSGRV